MHRNKITSKGVGVSHPDQSIIIHHNAKNKQESGSEFLRLDCSFIPGTEQ